MRIVFEDNTGSDDFRFFNLNLLRSRHILIDSVVLLSIVLGSAVRIAFFPPGRGCSSHFLACTMVRDKLISSGWKGLILRLCIPMQIWRVRQLCILTGF